MATMYDYLPNTTFDYDYTFDIVPQDIIVFEADKEVAIHRGRGINEERVILSNQSLFRIKLTFTYLSQTDHNTIFALFHDSDKACGKAYSFKWAPPSQYDSHTYVVRLDSSWNSFLKNYQNYGIASLWFFVLGRIAE